MVQEEIENNKKNLSKRFMKKEEIKK